MAAIQPSPPNMCTTGTIDHDDAERRRRRITLACAYCRYRKIRCDGAPVCKNCAEGSWRCEYVKVSAEENRAARERKALSKARQTKPGQSSTDAASSQAQPRARRTNSKRTPKNRADTSDDTLSPVEPGYGWPNSATASPYSAYTPSVLCSSQPPSLTSTASPSPASSTFFEVASPYPPPPPLHLSGVSAHGFDHLLPPHDAVWGPPSPPSEIYEERNVKGHHPYFSNMSAFKMVMDPTAAAAAAEHGSRYGYEGHEGEVHHYTGAGHPVVVPLSLHNYPLTPLPTPSEHAVFPHGPAFVAIHPSEHELAYAHAHPHHHHHHISHAPVPIEISGSPIADAGPYSPSAHSQQGEYITVAAHSNPDWDAHLVPAAEQGMYAHSAGDSPITLVSSTDGYHHASPIQDYEHLVPVSPMMAAPNAIHVGHDGLGSPMCSEADVFGEAGLGGLH